MLWTGPTLGICYWPVEERLIPEKSDSGHFGQKILHFLGNLRPSQDPVTDDTLS